MKNIKKTIGLTTIMLVLMLLIPLSTIQANPTTARLNNMKTITGNWGIFNHEQYQGTIKGYVNDNRVIAKLKYSFFTANIILQLHPPSHHFTGVIRFLGTNYQTHGFYFADNGYFMAIGYVGNYRYWITGTIN